MALQAPTCCANAGLKSRRYGCAIGCSIFTFGLILLIALLTVGSLKNEVQNALLDLQLMPTSKDDPKLTVAFETNNKEINSKASGKAQVSCVNVFNITNHAELLAGADKVKVEKVGPYCYDVFYHRGLFDWKDDGDKFEYRKYSNYTFNEKESKGNKETDILYMPNYGYILGMMQAGAFDPTSSVGEDKIVNAFRFLAANSIWGAYAAANTNGSVACDRWVNPASDKSAVPSLGAYATMADPKFDAVEIANNTRIANVSSTIYISSKACEQIWNNATTKITASPTGFATFMGLIEPARLNSSYYTNAEVATKFANWHLNTTSDIVALGEYFYRIREGMKLYVAQSETPIKKLTWKEFAEGYSDPVLSSLFGIPASYLAFYPPVTLPSEGHGPSGAARKVGFFTGKKDHRKAGYIYQVAGRQSYPYPTKNVAVEGWGNGGFFAFKRMSEQTIEEPQNFELAHWVDHLYQPVTLVNDKAPAELHGLKLITMTAEKEHMSQAELFWISTAVKDVTGFFGLPVRSTPTNFWNVDPSLTANVKDNFAAPSEANDHYIAWIEPITGYPFKIQQPYILNVYLNPRDSGSNLAQFQYSAPNLKAQPLIPWLDYDNRFEADAELVAGFASAISAYDGLVAAEWLAVFFGVPIMLFGIFFCVVLTPKLVANYEMNN